MRILIVGGTSFVGRAITWAAHQAGDDVTVFNRGQTATDIPASVTRVVGDRSTDLSVLEHLSFDVTIDAIAYRPDGVAALRAALGARAGHYMQISSISAYRDPLSAGATEDELELIGDLPGSDTSYGALKAACERAAYTHFGNEISIVRPTFVIGGHDATLRFPYWVERIGRGGDVALPAPLTNALQYIDARDVASFVVALAQRGVRGEFHVAGPYPAPTFHDVMEAVRARVGPDGTNLIPVDSALIAERHLEAKFPLSTGATSESILQLNSGKALAAGLRLRDLAESIDDVVTWWVGREEPSWWLTREEERELLGAMHRDER